MRSREAVHVCKLNQPIRDRFFCHVTIRLPKKIVSIGSSSHLFSLYKNINLGVLKRQIITTGDQICRFNITSNDFQLYFSGKFEHRNTDENPTSSWKAWSLGLSASSGSLRSWLYQYPSRPKLFIFIVHHVVSRKGEMNRDDKGFADPERIQKLVKNYSQFVLFPIYTKKKTKKIVEQYWEWELTNEALPSWLRDSKDVTTVEYNEFYRITLNTYMEPLTSPHFTTEIHGEGWCG
ncbi:unnamed protein product [Brassica napus]|uniref:(rape) hypothetical protein n=1 Tax=Brassica napus TaxID=3708 RepID=A0A816ZCU2_BRANA|nr:unnamed protein product [Brassica napus]